MLELPLPPFLPSDLESFGQHVAEHVPEWFEYYKQAFETTNEQQALVQELEGRIANLTSQIQLQEQELQLHKQENA